MAYTNLPPNLYDYFSTVNQRIRKLESAPDQAMTTATQATVQSTQALQAAQYANTQATTAIALANTKNTVFYSGSAPTANAVNDQWIDTAAGNKLYIWNGTAWTSAQDAAIAAAQTTANGKNAIYRQSSTPTGGTYAVGDMWFNTGSDNAISTWNGSAWTANALGTNALANFSANKITSGTIDASVVNVSNINAGNISSGYLAATRIQTGSLNANVLTSNTITATQIAAGTITSTEISSSYVYAGTITASQITAGTLTGFTIQTSSGTSAVTLSGSSNSIDFKSSGSTVGHIVPLNISGSTYGVIMHYGSSPDGSGSTYPQVYVGGSNASMGASSSYLFSSTTGGNYITGATTVSGQLTVTGNLMVDTISLYNSSTDVPVYWRNGGSSPNYRFYANTSSERYKDNITSVTKNYLQSILQLNPVTFTYKSEYSDTPDAQQFGLIAEQVNAIDGLQPMVSYDSSGQPNALDYSKLSVFLAIAIKELNTRLEKLEGANGTGTSTTN